MPIITNNYKPSSTADLTKFVSARSITYSNDIKERFNNDNYGDFLVQATGLSAQYNPATDG